MRNILKGSAVALVLLLLIEGGARTLITIRSDLSASPAEFYVWSAELGWAARPNFRGTVPKEIGQYERRFDSQGLFEFDGIQANGAAPTVVTIGDSSTFGWGTPPASSFSELLDERLPDANVVNLGMLGYTSFQGRKVMAKRALALRPALCIVSFNFNDRRYVLRASAPDSNLKFESDARAVGADAILNRIYTARMMRAALRAVRVGLDESESRAGPVDVRKLQARVPPESYRDNLIAMAQLCREQSIPLVFLALGDNPTQTEYLRQGIEALDRREYDLAINRLKVAISQHNVFSDLARKYLASAYEALGRSADATAAAIVEAPVESAHGATPVYTDVEYIEIMRQVGREFDVPVLDAWRVLHDDPSVYLDNCHPDERGHKKIADMLYPLVTKMLQEGRLRSH